MKRKFNLNETRFTKKKNVKSCNGQEVNDLENISCDLLDYSRVEDLNRYIPELVMATWNEDIDDFRKTLTDEERSKIMKMFWRGEAIPTAMKSVRITIVLRGITTHDVTHLIRHSGLQFAADCTGDKYIEERPLIVPTFFKYLPNEYHDRYVKIMKESYSLYDDICNNFTDKVHIQDIRLVLPRTLETFYYVTGSLYDFDRMLKQRLDMQFQPKSDNVFALRIYEKLHEVYPDYVIDFDRPNKFYQNVNKNGGLLSSKWYDPEPQDDIKELKNEKMIYGDMKKMYGYEDYLKIRNEVEKKCK